MTTELGRLEQVKVTDGWSMETVFSDWLSKGENIIQLTEALGIDEIYDAKREESIGRFRVDICGRMSNDRVAIIENQYGESDHDHLGKLVTYSSWKDASVIIWIVEHARQEHVSAVDWLNRNIPDKGFFMAEIRLYRIGDSMAAPMFNVVARPNDYNKSEKVLSERHLKRYAFWQQFLEYVGGRKDVLDSFPALVWKSPTYDFWLTIGKYKLEGFQIDLILNTNAGDFTSIGCKVYIPDNEELYRRFENHRSEIDSELGGAGDILWENKESKKSCKITIQRQATGLSNDAINDWFCRTMVDVLRVFRNNAGV